MAKINLYDEGTTTNASEKHTLEIVADKQYCIKPTRAKLYLDGFFVGHIRVTSGGFLSIRADEGSVHVSTYREVKDA